MGRADAVFHLHGLQHHQLRTGFDCLANLHQHPHDAAVHGRAQAALMAVAGVGFGNRVIAVDAVQLTIPLQVQGLATADRQVPTAQAVLVDQQLLAVKLQVRGRRLVQVDGLGFTVAGQVQADLQRNAGTKAAVGCPRRITIICPRLQRLALDESFGRCLPERRWQGLWRRQ
ncbi:hypothetical protein D3C80_1307500 [compost metagenome]